MTKLNKKKNNYHIATKLVHCGNYNDKFGARALPPPIYQQLLLLIVPNKVVEYLIYKNKDTFIQELVIQQQLF